MPLNALQRRVLDAVESGTATEWDRGAAEAFAAGLRRLNLEPDEQRRVEDALVKVRTSKSTRSR